MTPPPALVRAGGANVVCPVSSYNKITETVHILIIVGGVLPALCIVLLVRARWMYGVRYGDLTHYVDADKKRIMAEIRLEKVEIGEAGVGGATEGVA